MIESVAIVKKAFGRQATFGDSWELTELFVHFSHFKICIYTSAIENSQLCISKIDRPDAADPRRIFIRPDIRPYIFRSHLRPRERSRQGRERIWVEIKTTKSLALYVLFRAG